MKARTGLILLMLFGTVTVANAMDARSAGEQARWTLAEKQLVHALASPVENTRLQALKNAIIFAALYRDKVDLRKAVEPIQVLYEKEEKESVREMALAALQAIGSRSARLYLSRQVGQVPPGHLREVAAGVIVEHYQKERVAEAL